MITNLSNVEMQRQEELLDTFRSDYTAVNSLRASHLTSPFVVFTQSRAFSLKETLHCEHDDAA